MTINNIIEHLDNLIGVITFEYDGKSGGIDPLARNNFTMWYSDEIITVNSIDEVLNTKIFNNESLVNIWEHVENIEY